MNASNKQNPPLTLLHGHMFICLFHHRCRCSRCGCSCQRDQVEHRYRLSLTVARDRWIFGVTVFGACFNPQRWAWRMFFHLLQISAVYHSGVCTWFLHIIPASCSCNYWTFRLHMEHIHLSSYYHCFLLKSSLCGLLPTHSVICVG